MTTNPIAIGFDWSQAFDFPAGFFRPGDVVRAEFRQFAGDREARAMAGTRIEGDRLFVSLDQVQTASMAGLASSTVVTSFVVNRDAEEIAIGVIVRVPVVLLPTRPRA